MYDTESLLYQELCTVFVTLCQMSNDGLEPNSLVPINSSRVNMTHQLLKNSLRVQNHLEQDFSLGQDDCPIGLK